MLPFGFAESSHLLRDGGDERFVPAWGLEPLKLEVLV